MFPLCNFSSIFPGGQLTPFALMCGRPRAAIAANALPLSFYVGGRNDARSSSAGVEIARAPFVFPINSEIRMLA